MNKAHKRNSARAFGELSLVIQYAMEFVALTAT